MKTLQTVREVTTIHRRTARLAVIVLFAALLSAVPIHAAFAQTAPALGRAANFAVLGGTAVSLTDASIIGNVGSPVAVTIVRGTVAGTVYPVGDPTVIGAYNDFLNVYTAIADMGLYPCTGSLNTVYTDATLTLTPGVYCNDADVTFTRTVLTLDAQNDPNAVWIFKIGTHGTGALTGTSLSVVMSGGQPCNVYWWTAQGATMTTSNFKGDILAGAASTYTGGSVIGRTMTQAGLTMTGTDVFGCNNLVPLPDLCKDYCKDYCKDHDKYHCKDHEKDYCKDHSCMDHDKDQCKDNDKDHDKKDNDKDQNKKNDKDHGDRK